MLKTKRTNKVVAMGFVVIIAVFIGTIVISIISNPVLNTELTFTTPTDGQIIEASTSIWNRIPLEFELVTTANIDKIVMTHDYRYDSNYNLPAGNIFEYYSYDLSDYADHTIGGLWFEGMDASIDGGIWTPAPEIIEQLQDTKANNLAGKTIKFRLVQNQVIPTFEEEFTLYCRFSIKIYFTGQPDPYYYTVQYQLHRSL